MQIGDLVRITRAGIGRPAGTLALVMTGEYLSDPSRHDVKIWRVELIGYTANGGDRALTGRYLEDDLETVSESR